MYLGLDIGSVSIKAAVVDESDGNIDVIEEYYFRTKGDIPDSAKKLLEMIKTKEIKGIATTGSARKFVAVLISADIDVDEITAHRTAVAKLFPVVKTIFEIGGQDSKLIYFSDDSVNFEMNNVCAAGTGSFLDQQASRLGMPIEEFCQKGLTADSSHKIASKCTVFAETDMIHAQQSGVQINQVIRGVHKGLIDNYFSQLCRGKSLKGDFLFEGGTSENPLLVEELQKKLLETGLIKEGESLIVPRPYNKTLGAIGAAIICLNRNINNPRKIPQINNFEFLENRKCENCSNKCGSDITVIKINDKILELGKQCQN